MGGNNLDFWAQTKSLAKVRKFDNKPSSGSNTAFQANLGKRKTLHYIKLVAPLCIIVGLCDPCGAQSTHKNFLGANNFMVKLQSESHQIALHIVINERFRALERNCNAK